MEKTETIAKAPRKAPGLFTVFEGKKTARGRQFYAHMTGGGNITWATEGFDRVGGAFKACSSHWSGLAKRFGVTDVPPVPYTKQSLKPEPKAQPKGRKVADIALKGGVQLDDL